MFQIHQKQSCGGYQDCQSTSVCCGKTSRSYPALLPLYGEASTTITNGIWVDPGARAVDETDDLSSMITITGLVDIETPGTYYLRYNVTDSSGNSAQEIIRTVRVPYSKRIHTHNSA